MPMRRITDLKNELDGTLMKTIAVAKDLILVIRVGKLSLSSQLMSNYRRRIWDFLNENYGYKIGCFGGAIKSKLELFLIFKNRVSEIFLFSFSFCSCGF